MDRRTRTGLNILEAALLVGVLGDALLRATPWGLNVLLWSGALLAALCALRARWRGRALAGEGRWLLGAATIAAAAFAWRDSPTLKLLDALALCVALSLVAWRARGRSVRLARLADYARAVGGAALDSMFSALPLAASDVRWRTIPRAGALRHAAAVARGLLIAVPLLAVFGALLMAADAVFDNLVRDNLHVGAGNAFSHALVTAALAWGVAGFFRGAILAHDEDAGRETKPRPADAASHFAGGPAHVYTSVTADEKRHDANGESQNTIFKSVTEEPLATPPGATPGATTDNEPHTKNDSAHTNDTAVNNVTANNATANSANSGAAGASNVAADSANGDPAAVAAPRRFALGAVEVGTALGLLDLLFASFVLVQIRYFFGGAAHVGATTGLTYSEYARRGFFELVWVAALALPLLLAAHSLLRRDAATVRLFRALAGAQIALLFVIMASAVARMRLYQSEYGLTELRLYTTAFMLWLGLVFVWFAGVVLWRERRERFACGALVSAALVVGALHLLNPDAYIVRANAAHARRGRAFDAEYARALSADAVPAVLAALPSLPREARCALASDLLSRWPADARVDWRTWNVARARARKLVGARRASLEAEATNCPAPAAHTQTLNQPGGPTQSHVPTQSQAPTQSHAPAATTSSPAAATTNAVMPATAAGTQPVATTTANLNASRTHDAGAGASASPATSVGGGRAAGHATPTVTMTMSNGRNRPSERKAKRPNGGKRTANGRR
jgi:hypothetical protein